MLKHLKNLERKVRNFRKTLFMPFPDVNHLLHELRGQAFSRLDFSADHLVSVGCAGTWYFNWIQERFGDVKLHTGVEFYSKCPDDLPANCNWIANTAGHMPEILDESADAIFSGQNLEHLWPEEVIGFFLESNRILRTGGKLVVDSPNRRITERLGWSHPEHTVELTPDEAVELTELAGFDVDRIEGLWLCLDSENADVMPFESMKKVGTVSFKARMERCIERPEDSFIWWVVATKSDRPAQAEALTNRMNEIFAFAWPERCLRTKTIIGTESSSRRAFSSDGKTGVLLYGPYLPVKKGNYTATFSLRFGNSVPTGDGTAIVCDVVTGNECRTLGIREIMCSEISSNQTMEVTIPFSADDTLFGIQFRTIVQSKMDVEVEANVAFSGWDQWLPLQASKAA